MRYQRLRRFNQFQLSDGLFTRFALGVPPEGDLELILDRTNWKLGQQDVNILLLSAVWSGFTLVLMWTILPITGPGRGAADALFRGLSGSEDQRSAGRPGVRQEDLV